MSDEQDARRMFLTTSSMIAGGFLTLALLSAGANDETCVEGTDVVQDGCRQIGLYPH